jgi:hypothetical protein
MDVKDWITIAAIAQTTILAVLGFVFKAHFDRKLEEAKYEIRVREQAATIAELFAEWGTSDTPKIRNARRLNELYWSAVLWLPEDLVREVSRRLNNANGARDLKAILLDIRRLLQGKSDQLVAPELVHFD